MLNTLNKPRPITIEKALAMHRRSMAAAALEIIGDLWLTDDALQNAYLKIWQIYKSDPARINLHFNGHACARYFRRVAVSCALDLMRVVQKERLHIADRVTIEIALGELDYTEPEQNTPDYNCITPVAYNQRFYGDEDADAVDRLRAAWRGLPDAHRQTLKYVAHGYSLKEIAACEQIPINTVRTRIHYARKLAKEIAAGTRRHTKQRKRALTA